MAAVKFVNELELEEHSGAVLMKAASGRRLASAPSTAAAAVSDGKAQGFVDNGSLVSFTSNVTGQNKKDVLYSTLLAQRAANKKHDRFNDTKNWYKFYTDVMGKVGWVLQGFKFDEYQSSQSDFKISQITLELLSALIGPDAEMMTVVKATINNLAKSAEGVTLFGSSSASEKHGNFQIIPCTVDKSNQVNVAFIGGYFTARQVSKNYFFSTYSKQDIHLFKSSQVFTLNEHLYSVVRETVINIRNWGKQSRPTLTTWRYKLFKFNLLVQVRI